MAIKLSPERKKILDKYLEKYPKETNRNIIARIIKDKVVEFTSVSFQSLESEFARYRKRVNKQQVKDEAPEVKEKKKEGLEVRNNGKVVINWTNKTIITDLGEFGNMVCSFDMHKAVQRMYVHSGEGETAAIVAMKFDFLHAKAVHVYAKLHGFSKASLPQTDIEFEEGLSVEDAVKQNIQSLKRETYKQTEIAKWQLIQKNSDRWVNFHHSVLKPFENFIEQFIPTNKPIRLNTSNLVHKTAKNKKFAGMLGLSDWHYLKLCYGPNGERVYDREIAKKKITEHTADLLSQMLIQGKPEKIFVPAGGNDNIHIDGPEHTTTAGTPQINATDGIWRIGVEEYIDITIAHIESVAQVCDVEVVCFPGNHDEKTAALMNMFLRRYFEKDKRITVKVSLHPRMYYQYGRNCLIFTHGHHLGNKKLQREIHKIILGEAKENGIDMNNTDNYLLFTGHDHVGSFQDLNGNVQHFIMPSLAGTDDFWHLGQGYMGRAMESAGYLIDWMKGRQSIVYSS